MLIINHTRKAITIGSVIIPVESPTEVDDNTYFDAVQGNDALQTLVLSRKISAVKSKTTKASPKSKTDGAKAEK